MKVQNSWLKWKVRKSFHHLYHQHHQIDRWWLAGAHCSLRLVCLPLSSIPSNCCYCLQIYCQPKNIYKIAIIITTTTTKERKKNLKTILRQISGKQVVWPATILWPKAANSKHGKATQLIYAIFTNFVLFNKCCCCCYCCCCFPLVSKAKSKKKKKKWKTKSKKSNTRSYIIMCRGDEK